MRYNVIVQFADGTHGSSPYSCRKHAEDAARYFRRDFPHLTVTVVEVQ